MHAPGRPHLRLLVALVATAGLVAGGWLVLRDSGLAAVREVEVTGVSGPQAEAIRAELITAGRDMTTLHVRPDVLKAAVAPYAGVKAVFAEADFPDVLRVRVVQHVPVAVVVHAERAVPVAADGTLLRGTIVSDAPELELRFPPAGDRITDRRMLGTIALLARAPEQLRRKVATAFRGPRGLTVRLEAGPAVHFGSSRRTAAKWASLIAVLGSPASRGATTIDVSVPEHPAAAGLEQASIQQAKPSTAG